MRLQTEITLYRNAQQALIGASSGAVWAYPGTALSANTSQFYPNLCISGLIYARWVVAWNPSAPGSSPCGIRLVHADSGPTNEIEIAQFSRTYQTTPVVDAIDVTTKLNELITAGIQKTLAHQTYGNGANGPLIYGSWIECIWEI